MGPVYDRSQERLGSSDMMVIRTRKRLIDAAKSLRDRGQVPPGVNNPGVYAVRSGGGGRGSDVGQFPIGRVSMYRRRRFASGWPLQSIQRPIRHFSVTTVR